MGHIACWAMWWCIDGADDAGCLLAVDDIGQLNEQVVALQRYTTVFIDGESWRFMVFLSGDGKLMAVTNGGDKYWCCDDVTILRPFDHVLEHVRLGSFLRTIKADRRVEDVVHGACRMTNAFKKRLSDDIAHWLVGIVGQRAMAREFHEIWAALLHEAHSILAVERKDLPPRKAKEGMFDISTARLFLEPTQISPTAHVSPPNALSNYYLQRCMYACSRCRFFLRDFGALQRLWRKRTPNCRRRGLCQSFVCKHWQMLGQIGVEGHSMGPLDCRPLPLLPCQISHLISIFQCTRRTLAPPI